MMKAVGDLMSKRNLPLEQLAANRFRLRDAFARRIQALGRGAYSAAYDQFLLPGCKTPLDVSPEACFSFPLNQYPAPAVYDGPIRFNKHYYELPGDMNGEEAECAAFIDSLPEVEYWVRNLQRDQFAFWLQTRTDKFYPDFVAKLRDGRFLAVEFKGAHLESGSDAAEKDALGRLWEARSKGLCVFRTVGKKDMQSRIREAVAGRPKAGKSTTCLFDE